MIDKTALALAAFNHYKSYEGYPLVDFNYKYFGYYVRDWKTIIYGDKESNNIKAIGDSLHKIDFERIEVLVNRIIDKVKEDSPMYHLIAAASESRY